MHLCAPRDGGKNGGVDCGDVPGKFGLLFRKLGKNDLRVLSFAGSSEAKYSSTELNFWEFISLRLSKNVVE